MAAPCVVTTIQFSSQNTSKSDLRYPPTPSSRLQKKLDETINIPKPCGVKLHRMIQNNEDGRLPMKIKTVRTAAITAAALSMAFALAPTANAETPAEFYARQNL
ncbi:MAG: hypothetical protein ACI9MJ_001370, partial [Alphaproteobacteria bacterium]